MDYEKNILEPANFPFPYTAYNIQNLFMQNLYEVIENQKMGIFESPTGTGKSMSIICGVLKWLRDHIERQQIELMESIKHLEAEIMNDSSQSDWFSIQTRNVEVRKKIVALKEELEQIRQYYLHLKSDLNRNNSKSLNKPLHKKAINSVDFEDNFLLSNEVDVADESSDSEQERKYSPVKIYICSRTHTQLTQFVHEVAKSPYGFDARVCVLASRQFYCINENVTKLKYNTLMNDRCLDLKRHAKKTKCDTGESQQKKKKVASCTYYNASINNLRDFILGHVMDVEDLVKDSKNTFSTCPYYASRLAKDDAEIVLVPYNTILSKSIRSSNGISLKHNVVIFDEAHNIIDALSQLFRSEVSTEHLLNTILNIRYYKERYSAMLSAKNMLYINQILFVFEKISQLAANDDYIDNVFSIHEFVEKTAIEHYNLLDLASFLKDSNLSSKIRRLVMSRPPIHPENSPKVIGRSNMKSFLLNIEESCTKDKSDSVLTNNIENNSSVCYAALAESFLQSLNYTGDDGRIHLRKVDAGKNILTFFILNPHQHFAQIVNEARSVILVGGTMKPTQELKKLFQCNNPLSTIVDFSCDHVIDCNRILPLIITHALNDEQLSFHYSRRVEMMPNVVQLLHKLCEIVFGGIVVFFPSYQYENTFWNQLNMQDFKRRIFREPSDSNSIENVLKEYSDEILVRKKGALMLSVVGGKLSEGLNFSDDLGRCVVVVGMPYANIKSVELQEKMKYLDRTQGCNTGKQFYENMCMKAVNQAIGRAIRHKNDYASIILLDERYCRHSIRGSLPTWIGKELKQCTMKSGLELLQDFHVKWAGTST